MCCGIVVLSAVLAGSRDAQVVARLTTFTQGFVTLIIGIMDRLNVWFSDRIFDLEETILQRSSDFTEVDDSLQWVQEEFWNAWPSPALGAALGALREGREYRGQPNPLGRMAKRRSAVLSSCSLTGLFDCYVEDASSRSAPNAPATRKLSAGILSKFRRDLMLRSRMRYELSLRVAVATGGRTRKTVFSSTVLGKEGTLILSYLLRSWFRGGRCLNVDGSYIRRKLLSEDRERSLGVATGCVFNTLADQTDAASPRTL